MVAALAAAARNRDMGAGGIAHPTRWAQLRSTEAGDHTRPDAIPGPIAQTGELRAYFVLSGASGDDSGSAGGIVLWSPVRGSFFRFPGSQAEEVSNHVRLGSSE